MSTRRRPNSRNKADLKASMAREAASAVGQVPVLVDKPDHMPDGSSPASEHLRRALAA
jgi:hypothetical protein